MRWRGTVAIVNGRPILSSEDYGRGFSIEKKILVVILKGLDAMTN
jgi:hypothetical protein